MTTDPIIDEIREVSRRIEAALGNDWQKLYEHFLEVQKRAERRTYSGSPKRVSRQKR